VYFYTIENEAKIGSDLEFRGSVELTQVGKRVLRPKHAMPKEAKSK
jgi:hypothetical protein